INGVGTPDVRTVFQDRAVLIVVRGYHYKEDLTVLQPFIRDNRPIIVGVDGGADAVLDAGYRPDMIIGDMDSVSDRALRCGAELVVHAYRDGRAPGMERLAELGLDDDAVTFPAS
ncbi:putative cytokinetic ring protein SteA, partial [Prevotella bivia]|nr:putative cytokinetic ring protein SteA [Prevotella bivia]